MTGARHLKMSEITQSLTFTDVSSVWPHTQFALQRQSLSPVYINLYKTIGFCFTTVMHLWVLANKVFICYFIFKLEFCLHIVTSLKMAPNISTFYQFSRDWKNFTPAMDIPIRKQPI